MAGEFVIKDCALATISVGRRVQTLRELRNAVRDVPADSIYHHFWGTLLRPSYSEREYNNDFAAWAKRSLHDQQLAERLAVIDPTGFPDIEALRAALVEELEECLDECTVIPTAALTEQLYFLRGLLVVFDTHRRLAAPEELPAAAAQMSTASIFYHFIDARGRTEAGVDDFRAWLTCLEDPHEELQSRLASLDPYFGSLASLRTRLTRLFAQYFQVPTTVVHP
ncbi:MAG: hypothetical protein GXX83_09590 [Gaiellales bacterium]|nr:hypothetical protein [Gaiellales bacterium]